MSRRVRRSGMAPVAVRTVVLQVAQPTAAGPVQNFTFVPLQRIVAA
jgi:hypothetical protein